MAEQTSSFAIGRFADTFCQPNKVVFFHPRKHKPCWRRGNDVTPVSVDLRLGFWPLIGRALVAVLAEAEDGQHVPPLLPPQRVSFVQRGQLAAGRELSGGFRVAYTQTQTEKNQRATNERLITVDFSIFMGPLHICLQNSIYTTLSICITKCKQK